MASARQKRALEAGAKAPGVSLRGLDSTQSSLDQLRAASPVLLVFFKVSCPTCQYALPFLERIHREADRSRVAMYVVSQDDAEATLEFNAEFGITAPTLLDPEEESYPASNAFSLTNVPSMFFIEKDGRISWASVGFSKKDLLQLSRLLDVEVVRPGDYVPEWKAG